MNRLTCQQTFDRLDDYVDRELTEGEIHDVEEHLHVCAVCATEFDIERDVLREIRDKLRRIRVPADLMARISAALRSA